MTAQASKIIALEDWRKQEVSPTNSSTGAISLAEIQKSLEQVHAEQELITEQNRKIIDLLEVSNKKKYETTTKVAEAIVQPKIGRLSGPVQFFLKLLELWHLDSEDACKLLGYELADIQHVEQVLSGSMPFSRDLKDRITNLLVIRKRLSNLFRDIDTENEWLREKHAELGNKTPLELLLSGSMENLLLIKEFVEHVSGL